MVQLFWSLSHQRHFYGPIRLDYHIFPILEYREFHRLSVTPIHNSTSSRFLFIKELRLEIVWVQFVFESILQQVLKRKRKPEPEAAIKI